MAKPKRKPAYAPEQLALFEPLAPAVHEGALADLERMISSSVGHMMAGDPRSRFEIAGEVSALLADDVTKSMLDAYAAEAKDGHNISVPRFLALVTVTQRYDVLAQILAKVGCSLLVGEEIRAAELGHVEAEIQRLQGRVRELKRQPVTITRGGVRA